MRPRYILGGYAEWPVPPQIERVVESSWTYTPTRIGSGGVDTTSRTATQHRVLPHTGVSLVVHGAMRAGGRFEAHGLELQGAAGSYRFFRPGPATTLVAVRLRPEWVRAVVGLAASEVKDRRVDRGERTAWRGTRARLGRLTRVGEVLASLHALVHDRLGSVRADGAGMTAHRALERLRLDPASGRIAELAASAGVSERTLRRSVTAVTGMSPKWMQRVERLTRVVTAADGDARPAWSDFAYRFGYSDQAHLVREARALTGCTPKSLHRERRTQRPPREAAAPADETAAV